MWDDDDPGTAAGPADGLRPPWEAARSAWGWIEWTEDRAAPGGRAPIPIVDVDDALAIEDDSADPPPRTSRFRIVATHAAALRPALGAPLRDRADDRRATFRRRPRRPAP